MRQLIFNNAELGGRMSTFHNPRTQKNMIREQCKAFGRFNDWEQQLREKPDDANCLAAVFELYDLMPDKAKQRPVTVEGIIKMREGLSCLA